MRLRRLLPAPCVCSAPTRRVGCPGRGLSPFSPSTDDVVAHGAASCSSVAAAAAQHSPRSATRAVRGETTARGGGGDGGDGPRAWTLPACRARPHGQRGPSAAFSRCTHPSPPPLPVTERPSPSGQYSSPLLPDLWLLGTRERLRFSRGSVGGEKAVCPAWAPGEP